ncbi:pyruvate kinase [Neobacillus pocheonensis]|uniref:pyruvate kinase n=1 Tax=Neobacillus pocheonensis TaxID=363869 RepID=UPI003D26ADD8
MVNAPINQSELTEKIFTIYEQIIKESEQAIENLPVEGGLENRDNLLAFLALRKRWTIDLTEQLAAIGLSSIEHASDYVLFTLEKILTNLMSDIEKPSSVTIPDPLDAKTISNRRAEELLGKRDQQLPAAVMVTLDAKMIYEPELMKELLMNGMDIARINCAHNHQEIWKKIIEVLREAENKLKEEGNYHTRTCKIYMDLAGPKVRVGKLQPVEISVIKGDFIRLYLDPEKIGHPAASDRPAGIPVTLAKAFRNVRKKDRIFIDDGKINGIVQQVTTDYIEIEILAPTLKPLRIKEGKGLNLPDSLLSLNVPALTEKDIDDLPFILGNADILGISFVHTPIDLKKLREEMERIAGPRISVVAKIETKDAVHQLGRIILEGLKFKSFGIMIARGDLAVEVGFENLPFVQEEILNICSAAYIPAIWATGVLEKMTKTGIPSRGEMTDASIGKQAACIMLNKGPYINESLKMLVQLLKTEAIISSRKQSSNYQLTSQIL